jgi:hypothetical protein
MNCILESVQRHSYVAVSPEERSGVYVEVGNPASGKQNSEYLDIYSKTQNEPNYLAIEPATT